MSVHCVRSVFSLLRQLARPAVARLGPAGEIWGLRWTSTSQEVEQEESSNKYKYDVPAYTKIQAWDKGNRQLRQLSILMSSKGKRLDGDTLVLEGSRIIRDAVQRGFHPTDIVRLPMINNCVNNVWLLLGVQQGEAVVGVAAADRLQGKPLPHTVQ